MQLSHVATVACDITIRCALCLYTVTGLGLGSVAPIFVGLT